MKAQSQREIVIEIERICMIRKRARTSLEYCEGCGTVSDVIRHAEAARLFEMPARDLFQFIQQSNSHYRVASDGNINLCVTSLIERMKWRQDVRRLMPAMDQRTI